MRRLRSSMLTRLKLEARPGRMRFEIVPAVEMTRPWTPLSTVWMATRWSWPQRISSVPRLAKAWRDVSVLASPWRPVFTSLIGLWWIMTMRAASGEAFSKASLARSMSALLTYPITPRSLKRLVIEPRVMPWAVLRPAMTAPGTSREGLRSSEMYLVYREYLKLWACGWNRPPMLRATAPSQRMSWLPGMTTQGATSPILSRYSRACTNSFLAQRCVRSPEIATASGSISAISSLKESSLSKEAGRPKWRSET